MSDWFLPPGTPGSPDEWCFQTVATSQIRVFGNYLAYYARLGELIAQAKTGDEIFLVGWGFDLNEILKDNKSALFFLEAAEGRGAKVRLLATLSHTWSNNAAQVSNAVAKNIDAVIDDQLPSNALHHQKAVFIKRGDPAQFHLFLGGMDVATGRVDQWFDVQAEVVGIAARLGRKTLEERWESVRPPAGGISATSRSLGSGEKNVRHQVQFVRTYPPFPKDLTNWKRTYARNGDHTYYALICRALAKVKKTLYLEEQFLWTMGAAPSRWNPAGGSSPKDRGDLPDIPDTLDRLLKEAIGRGVKVVIIGPHYAPGSNEKRNRDVVVQSLASTTNPPVLLQVRSNMMFVHSKAWIFDDEFVVIGSGNFWHKSFVSVSVAAEAEFGVAFTADGDGKVLDFEGATFGKALRIRLWQRIRFTLDPNYVWPLPATASFEDEVRELKSAINGTSPFEPM